MRQTPGDGVPRAAFTAASTAPVVVRLVLDPAGEHRSVRLQVLADDNETQLVQAAERRDVRGREGSVRHVEVFLDGGVRTSHPREASTSTRAPTRRPPRAPPDRQLHPHLGRATKGE